MKTLWYTNKMKRFHKIISQIIGFPLPKDPMLFLLSNIKKNVIIPLDLIKHNWKKIFKESIR